MLNYNKQALELNKTLTRSNPSVYTLLSDKGQAIYFPKSGLLSQAAEAKGCRINATVGMGMNDDGTPMHLSCIDKYIDLEPGDIYPYAPSYGLPALREKWQELILKRNPSIEGNISLPVVCNGLTHGLSVVGQMFINSSDKIILPNIFWGNYRLIFNINCGNVFSHYDVFKNGGYNIEKLAFRLKGYNQKQSLILNFPHNPTGYTATAAEAEKIASVLFDSAERGNQILVILDDAYFGLVYEKEIYQESLFAKLAHLHKNILAVKIDGATKEDFAWGFRIGYITYGNKSLNAAGLKALENKTAGTIRSTISNCSRLSQSLILKGLNSKEYDVEKTEKFNTLKRRYEKARSILAENEAGYSRFFTPMPFNSGYFLCLKMKKRLNADKIRLELLEKYDIGLIALGDLLRVAFSSVAEDKLEELFEKIYSCCNR